MARYLIAATALPGHVAPLLAIAAHLRQRGHQVLLHTGSSFAAAARARGVDFVPFAAEIDYDYRRVHERFPDWKTLPSAHAQLCYGLRHAFADAMPAQLAGIDALLQQFRPDAIVVDSMFCGTLALQRRGPARPPVVGIGISALALSSADTAFFGTALPPSSAAADRQRNLAMARNLQQAMFGGVQQHFDAVLARLGLAPLPCFFVDAMIRLPERYLQLCVPGFEYPRSDLPDSVRFVGSLLAPASADFVAPPWWAELGDRRRKVLVTQGTLANQDAQQLIVPTLRALADRDDLLVIATTGRDEAPDFSVPANARVVPFLPYDRLLPQIDVLVSNGGYGSVNHALSLGVPLVVAGDSEEKPEIAARVAWSGAGINLVTGRPAARQIAEAVNRALEQPRYRERARQLRDEYARYDALGTIEAELHGLVTGQPLAAGATAAVASDHRQSQSSGVAP